MAKHIHTKKLSRLMPHLQCKDHILSVDTALLTPSLLYEGQL